MGKILLIIAMMSGYAFASGGGEGSTDIVQRTVNFIIFAGILYYLLASPIKDFFQGRTAGIRQELDRVQEKMKESKTAKEVALQKIEDAEKFAADLVENSKKENRILNDNIMQQCDSDLENVEKQNASLMNLEQRKMVRKLVNDVMDDLLTQESESFDKEAMAQLIMKKVA
ncbi:MAG: F0F1 ATP synthase subunit B [Campylobacterota bacterium]|nr:F0F1 ATP synthase subunit B [Campylobacterota bacterium]